MEKEKDKATADMVIALDDILFQDWAFHMEPRILYPKKKGTILERLPTIQCACCKSDVFNNCFQCKTKRSRSEHLRTTYCSTCVAYCAPGRLSCCHQKGMGCLEYIGFVPSSEISSLCDGLARNLSITLPSQKRYCQLPCHHLISKYHLLG